MKIILVAAILALATNGAQALVDVTKLAGKTEREISRYLGEPSSCSKTKCGTKCQYEAGETEIVFIDGKADWITIEGIDHVPFSETALTAIGLHETPPSFFNREIVYRWNSIPGFLEVAIFRGSGSFSGYAYIQVEHAVGNTYCPVTSPVAPTPSHEADSDKVANANPLSQIQFGAYNSSAMAFDAWQQLKVAFPEELENQNATVRDVTSGGRSLYRLRAGPMENAHDICMALRAKQQACIVVPH